MKKLIIISLASLFLMAGTCVEANAQKKEPPTVEQMAQRRTDRMVEKFQLNEEQAKKVYEINKEFIEENRKIQERQKQIKKEMNQDMREVLTPQQFKAWKAAQAPKGKAPAKKR